MGDRLIAKYDGGNTYFVHPNALGSTNVVTDQGGNVVQDQLFFPWGQQWRNNASITEDQRFASLGEPEYGLYPTPNRDMNPTLGRWMTPDPLAGDLLNPQSLNRYAYVLNNPTNLIDPLGLDTIICSMIGSQSGCTTTGEPRLKKKSSTEGQPNGLGDPFYRPGGCGLFGCSDAPFEPRVPPPPPAPPPAPNPPQLPSCFDVFAKAAGETFLVLSPSASTAISATQVAAEAGSNVTLKLALNARTAANALRAATAARVVLATRASTLFAASEVLGRLSPYLLVANIIGAEIAGIQAETDAFVAGRCK